MPPSEATLLKQAQAAAWALNQIGRQDYYNLCQRFIENAYGTASQFGSAAAAGNALNMKTDPYEADVGDLVFFRPDASNGNAGHVGINIGGGQMVSSTNKGVTVDNFLTNGYWKNLFVGIGDPPDQWQGRPDAKDLVSGATSLVAQGRATAGNAVAGAWGAAAPYAQQLIAASAKHGVPVNVLAGLLIQESGGDPRAVSGAGAQGVMQFMPGTARGLGIDPFNPAQAIDAGAGYLKSLADRAGGDWSKAVGMYNAGPAGNLNNAETRNHIVKVMGFADTIGASMSGGAAGGGAPGMPPPGGGGRRPGEDDKMPVKQQDKGLGGVLDYIGRLSGWDQSQGPPPTLPSAGDVARGASGAVDSASGWSGGGSPDGRTVTISIEDLKAAITQGDSALQDFLKAVVSGGIQNSPIGQIQSAGQGMRTLPGLAGQAAAAAGGILGNIPSIPNIPGIGPRPGYQGPMGGGSAGFGPGGGGPLGNVPAPGAPGGPAGPPGGPGKPPGRQDPGFTQGIAGQESRDQAGPGPSTGPSTAPAAAGARKAAGWLDPSKYPGAYGSIIEQANAFMLQIEDAQKIIATASPDSIEYANATKAMQSAQAALVTMGPNLREIQKEVGASEDGTILSGTTPSSKYITIIRKKPDGSGYEMVQIPNPNPEASTADIAAKGGVDVANINAGSAANVANISGATSRDVAGIQAGSAANVAGINAGSAANVAGIGLQGTKYTADAGERNAKLAALTQLGTTEMTTTTQRVTAALSAAVEQQRTKIDAAIRAGDLTLRDGTERFNQWYKQNVEAPLAILQQQRETEQYKLNQQEAVTRRATGQSEHERGVAQIGTQMWTGAANAYGEMIPKTVGAGWGEGFQRNLSQPGPYQGNTGATYNVSESMDEFATRKVAEMLKGVSPYAANIANSSQQLGANAAPMSGTQMTGLQNQATGVASNALANPYTMAPMNPLQMPGDIDIGAMAGIGAGNGNLITGAVNAAQPRAGVVAPPPQLPDFSYTAGSGPGRG